MLENKIVPYKSIMYDDCFIEILFTVLHAYDCPIELFYANEVGTYIPSNDSLKFYYTNQSLFYKETNDILAQLGIAQFPTVIRQISSTGYKLQSTRIS